MPTQDSSFNTAARSADKVWKPNSKPQFEFLSLPDTIFEAFYGGAVGGGKSEALLFYPIARRWHEDPNFKGIIFRRTFTELENSLIPRTLGSDNQLDPKVNYRDFGGVYNETKHQWKFPSGARIFFGYLEEDQHARKYDTAEFNYIAFDELQNFEEYQYLYLTHRARSSVSGLPAIIRAAGTPGGIGMAWVRKRFIEPHRLGFSILNDPSTNMKRIFIPAAPSDNPDLLTNTPNYLNQLAVLPEAEYRAKMGDWWSFSGQVFPEFRSVKIQTEPENALHVIPPFNIPSFWPVVLAIDWGYTAKTVALWGALSPDERIYIFQEYAVNKLSTRTWAGEVAKRSAGLNIVSAALDPSAWQKRGVNTIADEFAEASGMDYVEQADNARIDGLQLVREFLRWKAQPAREDLKVDLTLAQEIYRLKGPVAHAEYMKQFAPRLPETNLPRLQIFNTCTELISTIPLCVYNADGSKAKKEDVAEFNGDDAYDCLRYLLKGIDRHYEDLKREWKKRLEHQSIMDKFNETQDYNFLHRAMEKYESKHQNIAPVRTRHRHFGQGFSGLPVWKN